MNDEAARLGRPDVISDRSPQFIGRGRPRLVIEIPLECRARIRVDAGSLDDERRFRTWLRQALARRESLTEALEHWLDDLDVREAA